MREKVQIWKSFYPNWNGESGYHSEQSSGMIKKKSSKKGKLLVCKLKCKERLQLGWKVQRVWQKPTQVIGHELEE